GPSGAASAGRGAAPRHAKTRPSWRGEPGFEVRAVWDGGPVAPAEAGRSADLISGQPVHVPREAALDPRHPVRVIEPASGRAVEERNRLAQLGRSLLRRGGRTDTLDGRADPGTRGTVPGAPLLVEEHALLGA